MVEKIGSIQRITSWPISDCFRNFNSNDQNLLNSSVANFCLISLGFNFPLHTHGCDMTCQLSLIGRRGWQLTLATTFNWSQFNFRTNFYHRCQDRILVVLWAVGSDLWTTMTAVPRAAAWRTVSAALSQKFLDCLRHSKLQSVLPVACKLVKNCWLRPSWYVLDLK